MLNILYVDSAPFIGGAQESLLTLIDQLDRDAFRPIVAGPGRLASRLPADSHLLLALPDLADIYGGGSGLLRFSGATTDAALLLYHAAREHEVDIIHANGRAAWLPAWLAARTSGRPLVWHVRDIAGPVIPDRIAARLSDACIAPSNTAARHIYGLTHGLHTHVRVIPNPVDAMRFRPADPGSTRRPANWPKGAFVFGMMSQWVPWKRVDLFLDAAHQAASTAPSAFFLLCGAAPPGKDSSLRSRYSRSLEQIGLVLDWTPRPEELLNSIDCLAHPAEAEAFGRVVAEAMSCGKPVVAARAGALPELVLDGSTGSLFAPGNAGALAAAMIKMAQNPDRAAELGRAGRIRAERAFRPEVHAASVQDLYRNLMERPASQRRRP